ncbi:hypothetical protein P5V15_009547 [Pogonomyrmex californicus]
MFNLSNLSKFQRQTRNKVSKQVQKNTKKWRPFQATDFQSLMYPCFILCYIFGIFPYKIDDSTFKISKSRYIMSTVTICAVCIYQFKIYYDLYILNITKKINFNEVSNSIENNFYYIFSSFIVIITYILSNPRMRLLQTIMEVSSHISPKSYQKLSNLIHFKDIFGFLLLIVLMLISYIQLELDYALMLFSIYIGTIVYQMDMLYVNCVCILKICFKTVRDNLANLREPAMNDVHIYYKQENSFLLMELKALKKQHLIISDTVQMLNLVFSLQLLTSVIIVFIEITFNFYFLMLKWPGFTSKLYEHWLYIIIIYQFAKFLLIIWVCETGKNEALEIGTTVHVVFNSTSDERVKYELRLFSLQILHRKNVFSAKAFNIDVALLAAIIGNITTYILILIQFQLISNSCEGKSTNNITQII